MDSLVFDSFHSNYLRCFAIVSAGPTMSSDGIAVFNSC